VKKSGTRSDFDLIDPGHGLREGCSRSIDQAETTPMPLETLDKINKCLARAAELRERASGEADPALKAELHDLELQWLGIVESYKVAEQSNRFLKEIRA
jgi:hypothetical protein